MTLGCGAVAGNITSDNVGPQHLINIKRLAFVVRKPEEAFEMPLDYHAAPSAAPTAGVVGPVDRGAIMAAVERYLASRGIPVTGMAASSSCGCQTGATDRSLTGAAPKGVVSNVAADVVDKFLARRGPGSQGGFS
jgi:hypothetical protein